MPKSAIANFGWRKPTSPSRGEVAGASCKKGSRALLAYLVRRFALMLLTLFGISVIIFVLLRLVPGNIADILFDSAGMINPAEKAQIERELGLDKPIPVQYAIWIGGLLYCDLRWLH